MLNRQNGSPGRIRTYDQLVNSQLLYHWATEELGHCRAWLVFVKKIWKIKKVHTIGQVLGISQVVRQRTLTPPSGVRIPHPQPIFRYIGFRTAHFVRVDSETRALVSSPSFPTILNSNPCLNYSICLQAYLPFPTKNTIKRNLVLVTGFFEPYNHNAFLLQLPSYTSANNKTDKITKFWMT